MNQVTPLPTIKRSEYLRNRLIPDLENELNSTVWRNEKEKKDQESLLETYKDQLQNIENGVEQDNAFPDTVVEINTKTCEKTERPRLDND